MTIILKWSFSDPALMARLHNEAILEYDPRLGRPQIISSTESPGP